MPQFYGQHNSHADYLAILAGRTPCYGGYAYIVDNSHFINSLADKKKSYNELQHELDVAKRIKQAQNHE